MQSLEIKAIIEQARELVEYNSNGKSYDNKLGNAFLVREGLATELKQWAEYFGIDFAATNYTFSTSYTKHEDGTITTFINAPRVTKMNGKACLVWGDVNQPLENIKNRYVFAQDGKFNHVVCGEEGDDENIKLYVSLADKNLEPSKLNKLKKEGKFDKLAELLAPDNKRTHPRDCPKNTPLRVYSISPKDKWGKYLLEVEGCGLVSTNTRMKNQIEDLMSNWSRKPELKQYPVYVTFGKDYATKDGKQCTEANIKQDIPVAEFALADLFAYN